MLTQVAHTPSGNGAVNGGDSAQSPDRDGPFPSVVFAGGGCRCFWQVGFWEVAAPALSLRPRVVGAVSAGAAMACMAFGGALPDGIAQFKESARLNRSNVYPLNIFRRQQVFPHADIYRRTILDTLDAAALERLRAGPDIRVLLARLPGWLGPRSAVLAGIATYQTERILYNRVHPTFARRLGFFSEVVSVRQCQTAEEIADLVLQSSCTPPFTPVYRRDSRPVLDGGLIDNVPVEAVGSSDGPTLVLLTRSYPDPLVPRIDGRTYVQPSLPVPVRKWDYTSPEAVQRTYDLGRRDGECFARANAAGIGLPLSGAR